MFDEQQSKRQQIDLKLPLIVIACAGGGILLSFGLCGANAISGGCASVGIPIPYLARAGVVLFVLSILTIIAGCFWMIIAAIINAFRSH